MLLALLLIYSFISICYFSNWYACSTPEWSEEGMSVLDMSLISSFAPVIALDDGCRVGNRTRQLVNDNANI